MSAKVDVFSTIVFVGIDLTMQCPVAIIARRNGKPPYYSSEWRSRGSYCCQSSLLPLKISSPAVAFVGIDLAGQLLLPIANVVMARVHVYEAMMASITSGKFLMPRLLIQNVEMSAAEMVSAIGC
jgi:hypothetical protein